MISDRAYNTITKTIENIVNKLNEHNITHEILGDHHTFAIAPSCSIHTEFCTIDVWKDQIKVNEKTVDDIADMIKLILGTG
jgi:hypothetical protein